MAQVAHMIAYVYVTSPVAWANSTTDPRYDLVSPRGAAVGARRSERPLGGAGHQLWSAHRGHRPRHQRALTDASVTTHRSVADIGI